jgi:hypothetical protein
MRQFDLSLQGEKMTEKHTAGPLTVEQDGLSLILANQIVCTAFAPDYAGIDEQKANARRLAACWNACAGIDIDLLESQDIVLIAGVMAKRVSDQTRDKLLACLKETSAILEEWIKDSGDCDHRVGICFCDDIRAVEGAKAAITEAEDQP